MVKSSRQHSEFKQKPCNIKPVLSHSISHSTRINQRAKVNFLLFGLCHVCLILYSATGVYQSNYLQTGITDALPCDAKDTTTCKHQQTPLYKQLCYGASSCDSLQLHSHKAAQFSLVRCGLEEHAL